MAAVNKPLSEKLTKFVEAYTGPAEGNGAKAAESVGCSKASAKVMASRWLNRADVQAAIVNRQVELVNHQKQIAAQEAEQRQVVALVKIADAVERRELLTDIARQGKDKDRVRAVDVLNKMDGMYTPTFGLGGDKDGGPVTVRFEIVRGIITREGAPA